MSAIGADTYTPREIRRLRRHICWLCEIRLDRGICGISFFEKCPEHVMSKRRADCLAEARPFHGASPMSESMIERVARAICQEENRDPDRRMPTSINPPDGRPLWTSYEWQARAAIEAMREPTEEMLVAGRVGEGGRTQAEDVWADMIAAALGEDHP